jgi:hypothetical protein
MFALVLVLPLVASPPDGPARDEAILHRVQQSIGGQGGAGGNANVIIQPGNTIILNPQGGAGGGGGNAFGGPGPGPSAGADPVQVVRAFYAALSRADGATASNFVVPEKRGYGGPLSAGAISGFYSQLPRPLSLIEVRGYGDVVQVRYQLTRPNGTLCNGKATVNTVSWSGQTLISSIDANC